MSYFSIILKITEVKSHPTVSLIFFHGCSPSLKIIKVLGPCGESLRGPYPYWPSLQQVSIPCSKKGNHQEPNTTLPYPTL